MASTSFKDLFDEAESGVAASSVPSGSYDVVVTSTRPLAASSLIWLTFEVLNGPQQGKEVDVNIWFPNENSKRGARIYFQKKIAGFLAYPDVKAAGQASEGAPSEEAALQLIADALIGKQVKADVKLRTDGDYAGSNELSSTRTIDGAVQPAPTPTTAAAEPAVEAVAFGTAVESKPATGGAPF